MPTVVKEVRREGRQWLPCACVVDESGWPVHSQYGHLTTKAKATALADFVATVLSARLDDAEIIDRAEHDRRLSAGQYTRCR